MARLGVLGALALAGCVAAGPTGAPSSKQVESAKPSPTVVDPEQAARCGDAITEVHKALMNPLTTCGEIELDRLDMDLKCGTDIRAQEARAVRADADKRMKTCPQKPPADHRPEAQALENELDALNRTGSAMSDMNCQMGVGAATNALMSSEGRCNDSVDLAHQIFENACTPAVLERQKGLRERAADLKKRFGEWRKRCQ